MREIPEVDDVTLAFPADVIGTFLPNEKEIPEEFWGDYDEKSEKWRGIQNRWFFKGINTKGFVPKEGVDGTKALRVLAACQGSYQPSHEHKMAGVAYLMSEWFDDYQEEIGNDSKSCR